MKHKHAVVLAVATVLSLMSVNSYAEPVEAGFGAIKAMGLMQFWYVNDNGAKPNANDIAPKDTFRLRRAEIKLSGEIKPEVSWAVMIDPAQIREDDISSKVTVSTDVGRKSLLQDFVITYKRKSFSVDFGQYRIPFGMEGLESSSKLDFAERAMLAPVLKWSDYRDVGLTLKGDFKVREMKVQPQFGVYNGEGQNKLEANKPFDFAYKLVVKSIEKLHLGAAHYYGKTGSSGITDNYRTGFEAKFSDGPVVIYGEYIKGKSSNKKKETYYATAVYKFLDSYQAAVRHDYYDPDMAATRDAQTETTIGLNRFLANNNAKFQLNYVFRGEKGANVSNDVIRVNVQIAY